jgi:transcription initiation factor TFIID subunit 2
VLLTAPTYLTHALQYSDAFYICTNITALAAATLCTTAPERGELTQSETIVEQTSEDVELMNKAIAEVERYRNMDRLIPSYHNVVTIAALEVGVHLRKTSIC